MLFDLKFRTDLEPKMVFCLEMYWICYIFRLMEQALSVVNLKFVT